MTLFRKLILISLLICGLALFGADDESLTEVILQYEVNVNGASKLSPDNLPILIVVEANGSRSSLDIDRIAQYVQLRLGKNGISSRIYDQDFRKNLLAGKLSRTELFSPKLAVEVSVRSFESSAVSCRISYVQYRLKADLQSRYQAVKDWGRENEFHNVSADVIESTVGQFLEKEIGSLVRVTRTNKKRSNIKNQSIGRNSGPSDSHLSYSLNWNDPDNRRNRFTVGVVVGTPALGNLHLGFWGSQRLPLIASVSGMYYAPNLRGLQAEVGWAFDNSGNFKQALSIAAIGFNGTRKNARDERDIYGRIIKTTIDTVNEFHPYLGPTYIFDWNDFRLQGGVATRLDASREPQLRFLIQIGYTPRIRF